METMHDLARTIKKTMEGMVPGKGITSPALAVLGHAERLANMVLEFNHNPRDVIVTMRDSVLLGATLVKLGNHDAALKALRQADMASHLGLAEGVQIGGEWPQRHKSTKKKKKGAPPMSDKEEVIVRFSGAYALYVGELDTWMVVLAKATPVPTSCAVSEDDAWKQAWQAIS